MEENLSEISLTTPAIPLNKEDVLEDYRLAYRSREVSLLGRREVLTGKAKFGIFGDGKEVAQLAMSKVFRKGDIRSGYYRDQTFAFAKGMYTFEGFFSQLYSHIDISYDPHSGGRMMNNHIATRLLDDRGQWKNIREMHVSSADVSCTAAQMPRLVGLAQASVLYRHNPELKDNTRFSDNGNEIVFGTIGNGSCAEGHFWEAVNAIGVLGAPAIISIWDDEYGISVPNELQITKGDLSEVLKGFQREEGGKGYELFCVKAWDYPALLEVYQEAEKLAREAHIPSIIHVVEVTQPQGHSTSGSHERYKSKERLAHEAELDCLSRMRNWILENEWISEEELAFWEKEDKKLIRKAKQTAWNNYLKPIKKEVLELTQLYRDLIPLVQSREELTEIIRALEHNDEPFRGELLDSVHQVLLTMGEEVHATDLIPLRQWRDQLKSHYQEAYSSYLTSDTVFSPMNVHPETPEFGVDSPVLKGYEILNQCFDHLFSAHPEVVAFGEDVGQLGDVNQGFAGLQAKYGRHRIMDTGIREATIMGQAIGLALRGLRPIAEIQYLDYFIYGMQTLSDDLASLSYRTHRGQKAPVIIRTRGHRLEGIWHAGSPMGMIVHALRGIHICVPRNMVQAAGMYNTLIAGDEPAVVVEVLNGYRLKEKLPQNLATLKVPLGVPECIREGNDITVVTYGACCRLALEAAKQLEEVGISVEVIDIQTLLPFDTEHKILDSIKKTNRVLFLDEDVPGGASAYMMQQVLEKQGAYRYLDSSPTTLSAQAHRCAYGTDGDYFSKPQTVDIFHKVYDLMNEAEPTRFPSLY